MAIKTREFLTETGDTFGIDVYINQFLMSGYVEQLIDIKYQEDLFDSFFPKPVVPQYVADWYEENKNRKGKMVNGTFVKEEDL